MQFHGKEQKISQNKLMYLYIYTYIIWLIFSVSLSAMQNEWLPFNSFVRPSVLSQSPTRSGFDLEFSVSNYLKAMDTNLPTYINIDYEKYTTILSYRRDFYDTFWMTVSLPFYVYSGGFLDSTISGWHNFWGLPNSDHDHVNNNQFSFRLKSDGVTYVNLTEAPLGFGDLSFYFFGPQSIGEVILTPIVLITLPTGDEDQLLGTGQVSGAMGLRLSRLWCGINFDVQGYLMPKTVSSHYSGLQTTQPYQIDGSISFTLFGIRTTHVLSIYRAPITNTGISKIDTTAVVYYGTLDLVNSLDKHIHIYLQEDLNVSGSPDFTIGIVLFKGFKRR